MDKKKEQLWHAYLDGELSVSESSEFEATLTDEERDRLAAEMRLENGISEVLSQDATCPDDVWERTRALVREQAAPENAVALNSRRRWFWGAASLAAAAAVAFVISMYASSVSTKPSSAFAVSAATVEELAQQSEIESGNVNAEEYFHLHHINLVVRAEDSIPLAQRHKGIRIVGARESKASGDPVIEMLMGCCDRPVKIIVARRDSAAGKAISAAALDMRQLQGTRNVGEYVAAVVGDHHAFGLLDMLEEQAQ